MNPKCDHSNESYWALPASCGHLNKSSREVRFWGPLYYQAATLKVSARFSSAKFLRLLSVNKLRIIFLCCCSQFTVDRKETIQKEQECRSGESIRLPPMWPGFDSRTRRVEFVVGPRPWVREVFLRVLRFPFSSKTNTSKFIRSGKCP